MQFFSNALGIGRATVLCNNAELVSLVADSLSSQSRKRLENDTKKKRIKKNKIQSQLIY